MFWEWWQSLFVDMSSTNFFNFSFLPKYGYAVIQGVEYTLILSVISVLMAVLPALLLATMRLSKNRAIRCISGAYIAAFRSTPILVQLMIIYYGVFSFIIVPKFMIFGFIDSSRFIPGVVALALNSSAYVAEIFRAGIMSIDNGQFEAGRSLGFNYFQTMRYIVVPQMFKSVLPTLCNEFIALLKETSVVGYVGVIDITKAGNVIAGVTYSYYIPLLTVAAIYLVMVMILSYFVGKLEKRLRKNER